MAKITETLLTLNVMGDAHVAKVFGCQALHEGGLGAGIMEADDCQVTTVFTVQPSFYHRHSTNRAL